MGRREAKEESQRHRWTEAETGTRGQRWTETKSKETDRDRCTERVRQDRKTPTTTQNQVGAEDP